MLVRPTCTRPPTRTAATPTVAQSWARRAYFRYVPSAPFGTRISVSTSCRSSAVSNGPVKNDVAGIARSPPGPRATSSASSVEQDGAEVGRGVGVSERAADRPAVANLRIADVPRRVGENGAPAPKRVAAREVGVPAERSDRDPLAVVPDEAKVVEPTDVDEQRRTGEAQPHQRDQRVPAREQPRLVVPAEELESLVDRPRPLVLEGRRDHAPALAAAWTARTMLWYPVQRQRLPSSACRISSSDGSGFSRRSETDAITNPGVQ